MPEISINRDDLENMARKLDEMAPSLNYQEQVLLHVVFGMASQTIDTLLEEAAGETTRRGNLLIEVPDELSDQASLTPLSTDFLKTFDSFVMLPQAGSVKVT